MSKCYVNIEQVQFPGTELRSPSLVAYEKVSTSRKKFPVQRLTDLDFHTMNVATMKNEICGPWEDIKHF